MAAHLPGYGDKASADDLLSIVLSAEQADEIGHSRMIIVPTYSVAVRTHASSKTTDRRLEGLQQAVQAQICGCRAGVSMVVVGFAETRSESGGGTSELNDRYWVVSCRVDALSLPPIYLFKHHPTVTHLCQLKLATPPVHRRSVLDINDCIRSLDIRIADAQSAAGTNRRRAVPSEMLRQQFCWDRLSSCTSLPARPVNTKIRWCVVALVLVANEIAALTCALR